MIRLENKLRLAAWGVLAFFALSVCVSAFNLPGADMLERSTRLFRSASAAPETVLPARIEPQRVVTAACDYTAVVTSLPVTAGTYVKEGELLASLHSDELAADNKRAQRRLELAQQRYAFLKGSSAEQSPSHIRDEELAVAKRAVETTRERAAAYSISESAEAYASARQRVSEVKDLVQQKLATQYEYDDAVARERNELRNLNAGREHLSRLRQEAELASANLRMLEMKSGAGSGLDLRAAEIEMKDAAEALATTQQRTEKCQVRSRISGTVVDVLARTGDTVPGGSALLQIADLKTLTFESSVTASIARALSPGLPVTVRVPTDPPSRIPAKISSVSAAPDRAQKSYLLRISVPNPDPGTILAGLEGAVEIPHQEHK